MADITQNPYVRRLWLTGGDEEADHVTPAGKAVASLVARGQWNRAVEQRLIEICHAVHDDPSAHDWNELIPRFASQSRGGGPESYA